MPSKKTKITIDKIPEETVKLIRESFSYQGLKKALNSKIISKADIKAEAINEQKNKDLIMNQRVHTVLAWDLEKNLGSAKPSKTDKASISVNNKKNNKIANKIVNKSHSNNVLEKLKQKLGQDFGVGWKGIDPDGDLLEVLEILDQGWIKFKVEKISGEEDIISFLIDRFIKSLDISPIYGLDQEEASDLATSNLKKMNNKGRLNLMNKIHLKTMAELQRIKSKQRDILGQILRKNEDKKIKELLANINSG